MVVFFFIIVASLVSVAFAWAISASIRIWSARPADLDLERALERRTITARRVLAGVSRSGDEDNSESPSVPSYALGPFGSSGVPSAWLDELWERRN
jgi:hypothetical protein